MKQKEKIRTATFERFLSDLGTPVSQTEIRQVTRRVLTSIADGESERLMTVAPSGRGGRRFLRWRRIAVSAAILIVASALQFLLLRSGTSDVLARTAGGKTYIEGEIIRSADIASSVLFLSDDSQVEASSDAELSVSQVADGLRVYLSQGHVIITAAKQHGGHLYVETRDCLVSVIGTVFSVKAGPAGSRVSVIEGEVNVRQGAITQVLMPGDQVSTSPVMQPVPLKTDIEWSQNAPRLIALLEQRVSPPAAQIPQIEEGVIRGMVTLAGTTQGISGATINLCPETEPVITSVEGNGTVRVTTLFSPFASLECQREISATTDDSGGFLISDVSPGRYTVRAQKSGFVATLENFVAVKTEGVTPSRNLEGWNWEGGPTVATQKVRIEQLGVEVKLNLVHPAFVRGKVRDEDGRLAPYLPVRITLAPQSGDTSLPGKALASVNTNANGEYRFRVPPGDYIVSAGDLAADSFEPIQIRGLTGPLANAVRVSLKQSEEATASDIVFRPLSPQR